MSRKALFGLGAGRHDKVQDEKGGRHVIVVFPRHDEPRREPLGVHPYRALDMQVSTCR